MTLTLRYAVRSDRRAGARQQRGLGLRRSPAARDRRRHGRPRGRRGRQQDRHRRRWSDSTRTGRSATCSPRCATPSRRPTTDRRGGRAATTKLDGMGTTLTALRFTGAQVGLVHVGDSRAYLLRNGHLSQITHDDTYVQSLVDSGRLTPDEATHHPRKSVILRALTGADVEPDVSIREARAGDRYLLCTDGLSDVVSAATIARDARRGRPAGVRRPARRAGPARRRPGQRHVHRRRRRRHRVRRRPARHRRRVRRSDVRVRQRRRQPGRARGADDPAGHRTPPPASSPTAASLAAARS